MVTNMYYNRYLIKMDTQIKSSIEFMKLDGDPRKATKVCDNRITIDEFDYEDIKVTISKTCNEKGDPDTSIKISKVIEYLKRNGHLCFDKNGQLGEIKSQDFIVFYKQKLPYMEVYLPSGHIRRKHENCEIMTPYYSHYVNVDLDLIL